LLFANKCARIENQKIDNMEKIFDKPRFLSTGQAATLCSVTPDTVLKWIRSGRLPARRTAGGHHRIDLKDLERLITPVAETQRRAVAMPEPVRRQFRYCWEYNSNGELSDRCRRCPAYLMRAQRCYEVANRLPRGEHQRHFCQGTCSECDYYREVHEQTTNVLVVTDDAELSDTLTLEAARFPFNLQVADCEYNCSAIVNHFKPDFAFVDCSLGREASRDISFHLAQDPRIPFVRVVLAGAEDQVPSECDKEVFARIERPFTAMDISNFIDFIGDGYWDQLQSGPSGSQSH
jgi:excisionase family DNA binding protein